MVRVKPMSAKPYNETQQSLDSDFQDCVKHFDISMA